ncbi:sulfonate ABC transporter substrate-binding protein [Methylobacterium dankookense]|uniref:Putative aliphatic sulfonates-binding protein n=1 Tax=Methylobacterium dankookense TaxID=560405 RepID=A0A564FVK0_9HYPH|nr:sulfonate ABC transporter substrate-binding protein [Methylobacterium dankookense]GJD56202.1 Putative aliphatic sulfonates-binding protein [Methylobacterium dankookense]VUF11776.1 Putative aliphatic sulfonates-binding protein [Methylobacterium dankookense]
MTTRLPSRAAARAASAPTSRRTLLAAGLGLATWLGTRPVRAAPKTLRIGYQKYGTLVLLKSRGSLEKALAGQGVAVTWSEFPSGPPLLEALNAGAIDFGSAGEAPPIFAQAASPELRYVAAEPPAPRGEAILVPKDSPIRTVADLRGKTIALNKGSNVHALLLRALEKAGVPYEAVTTAFLAPADANAAFLRGSVDAWVIWDPYQAAAERATGARTLTTAEGLAPNRQFYLASRTLTETAPGLVVAVLDAIAGIDAWAKDNTAAVAAELAPSVGIPAPVLAVALERQSYGVAPLDAEAVAEQQRIADSFHALKLIPRPIRVSDAVWTPPARNG